MIREAVCKQLLPVGIATVSMMFMAACASPPTVADPGSSLSLPQLKSEPPVFQADVPLAQLLVASCFDEEKRDPDPVMSAIGAENNSLLLMLGDNVYGDYHNGRYRPADANLTELREAFSDLAAREDFALATQRHAVMVTWDDHDYGKNDAGARFKHKLKAEQIHEHFWRLHDTQAARHPGVYYARQFGPAGQRVQVLMLDTRFFRTPLTKTDQRGAKGRERYRVSQDRNQDMLGQAQWQWLEQRLAEPADLRIIGSSIQVLPRDHGWESWSRLPAARERLMKMLSSVGSGTIVLLSGDRHHAFLYRTRVDKTVFVEMTASSVNRSFRRRMGGKDTSEKDALQIGAGYSGANYGRVSIDWSNRQINLSILNADRQAVRSLNQGF